MVAPAPPEGRSSGSCPGSSGSFFVSRVWLPLANQGPVFCSRRPLSLGSKIPSDDIMDQRPLIFASKIRPSNSMSAHFLISNVIDSECGPSHSLS